MIVCDSSPVIVLGKVGKLSLLKDLFEEILIPEEVYSEVMKKEESAEAVALDKGVEEGWIVVEEAKGEEPETQNLGEGEKAAIALSSEREAVLIVDDGSAKSYASIFGVESHGTLYILLKSVEDDLMESGEAVELVDDMMREGFYLSTDTYRDFLKFMEE